MKLNVYSIKDAKADTFGAPFYQHTHGLAERRLRELANDPRSEVNKYTEDFDLWFLGQYDEQTGKFDLLPTPQHQIKAVQLKEAKPLES